MFVFYLPLFIKFNEMSLKINSLFVLILLSSFALLVACKQDKPLPVLGNKKKVDGVEVDHTIPDFSFTNQLGNTVTNSDFEDKIYIADFFFTTCPTICPAVMSQMLRIYDKYEDNPQVGLLSHTLDPKIDSIGVLKNYGENLEIEAPKWHLVTGPKDDIHNIVDDYMNIVIEDPQAPGGINHTGKIILVDKDRKIRSFADGTDPEEVSQLLLDIDKLLNEYSK